ncbi:MAG: hypothetical protein D6788_09080, partial [Planctomycetota bacterium]
MRVLKRFRMIILHAIWRKGRLYVWGEETVSTGGEHSTPTDRPPTTDPPSYPGTLSISALRDLLGEASDSLLVTGAAAARLLMHLPIRDRPG